MTIVIPRAAMLAGALLFGCALAAPPVDARLWNSEGAAPRACGNVRTHYKTYPKSIGYTKAGKTLLPGSARPGQHKSWQLTLAIASAPLCR